MNQAPDGSYLWPGFEGIPFRSRGPVAPDLRADAPDRKQPLVVQDAKVAVFDLSKPEDLKAYQDIFFKIGRGQFKLSAEERQYDPDIKNWRVFLRYSELYFELPES